jgi:hypothetical protein
MEVEGVKQAAESKDASKKITIGLWKFQIPNPEKSSQFSSRCNDRSRPGLGLHRRRSQRKSSTW